jgi:hypothetical protein
MFIVAVRFNLVVTKSEETRLSNLIRKQQLEVLGSWDRTWLKKLQDKKLQEGTQPKATSKGSR